MQWQNPEWLWALWALPFVAAVLVYRHRKCRAAAGVFADPEMAQRIIPAMDWSRPLLKGALVVCGLAGCILALARPRAGVYYEELTGRGVDLFVVLDASRSMLATDVKPSRLERAKADVIDLLDEVEGDRVGLIAFAGKAVIKCPLTLDYGFFKEALWRAGPDDVPMGGSLIGDALRKAGAAFKDRTRQRLVVLITDGEDQDSFPLEAADTLAKDGVKVVAIGLGDPSEGARVPGRGGDAWVMHEGQVVWSKMDERTLQEIAQKTGGAYIPVKTRDYDLAEVYRTHIQHLEREDASGRKRKRLRDRFQWCLWPALLCLLLDAGLTYYPRRRERRA